MSVGELCTREVVIVEKDASINEVAQLMRKCHVGDIVVVERKGEQNIPVGIITDRDIVVELIAENVDLESVTTGDVMSYELITAREEEGVWTVLQKMRDNGVRRVPIVNGNGGLEGILAVDDLIELLAEELNLLAKLVIRGQYLEMEKR